MNAPKMRTATFRLTLSIGLGNARHEETITDEVPANLTGDDLEDWINKNIWVPWSENYIDGAICEIDETSQ